MTLPDGRTLWHANAAETLFLFNEVFTRRVYLRHGITIPAAGTVVDVGANVGLFALQAAQQGAARVLAVEAIPSTCAILSANARDHAHGVILPVGCALGATAETATFTHYPQFTMMSGRDAEPERDFASTAEVLSAGRQLPVPARLALRAAFAPERVEVRVRRLSDVLREHGIRRVDLLKVDVERAELDVLRGVDAGDWPSIMQVVAEVHDEGTRLGDVEALLRGAGMSVVTERDDALAASANVTVFARRE